MNFSKLVLEFGIYKVKFHFSKFLIIIIASPLTQPAYPGFFPVNGVGQIGEQALKTYWENFAKSSDPDYNKRQATAKIETKHSETLTDKVILFKIIFFY